MYQSISRFQHVLRLALLALPVLLLLGLNGRTVSVLRPAGLPVSRVSVAPRATVIKQKVAFEAASPLGHYVAPAAALGWLPGTPAVAWLPRLARRVVATAGVAVPAAFVALRCRQRLLAGALSPQAP